MNNEIKQKIIELNRKFGINTEFVVGEDVLGYALGNTIYINESIEQDYEKTNKHELMHFFTQTEAFKNIKKELFEKQADKLEEIRNEYELRYYGLYSEAEIEAGAIDDEIAIDLMVDNSTFKYEEGLKIGDKYLGKLEQELDEKRYLNLSLSANIKNLKLSDWEKIFVLNYYDGKERKLPQDNKIEGIKADIQTYLNELYNISEEKMRIKANSPEVIREYESEIKALMARGEDVEYLQRNKDSACNEIATRISEQLYAEYKHIADLIKGLNYEPAFKCMMLRETLTKTYKIDKEQETGKEKTIVNKRKLNQSIAGHMILTESTLKNIYENVDINNQSNMNFANIYIAAVEIYKNTIAEKSQISLDGVETYGKGSWVKFDGKTTSPENYFENAKKLSALVQDTPWCTKTLASSQLADGDFYVFIDEEKKPHIAVKMNGNSIDEVRGIQNGNAQELEEEYRDVAISFLENNKDIEHGKEWYEKEQWNKRLIMHRKKIEEGSFTKEDVPQFTEDYFKADYRSHGGENSNRTALNDTLKKYQNKIVVLFADYYQCKEEAIYVGDLNKENMNFDVVPYKIVFGNVDFSDSTITNLGQLQRIGGNANFQNSKITNLGQLQKIGGDASFYKSKITNLGKLQNIGGNVHFANSKITDLGQLQNIGGDANFETSQMINLGQLQNIGGYAVFGYSQIIDLGQLQSIGGYASFYKSKITNLGQLQRIGGDALFYDSPITDLGQLQRIGGDADFKYSQITDLGQLQRIGGDADFKYSQITDLGQLQSIGENADFSFSKLTDLGQLQSIGGVAVFSNSPITNLGQLQSIGGYAVFSNSKVIDLGQLKSIDGSADFRESQIVDLGQLQSIGENANFINSEITDLGQLQSIGKDAFFTNSKITDLGKLQNIGGDAVFWNSQITDLGELQSIGGGLFINNMKIKNAKKLQSIGERIYKSNMGQDGIWIESVEQLREKMLEEEKKSKDAKQIARATKNVSNDMAREAGEALDRAIENVHERNRIKERP